MAEKPLDRLNYYNGQRLEASDLRTEQDYHMRVRRWLNKAMYTVGVVDGLAVTVATSASGSSPCVVVSPGIALDAEGREIILLDNTRVCIVATPSTIANTPPQAYLTIEYREQPIEEQQQSATVRSPRRRNANVIAWGGPALIRAQPVLGWTTTYPPAGSSKVVLALVTLKSDCSAVTSIDTSARQTVQTQRDAKVRQYALEGARDLDENNPQTVYFHIRGNQPSSVTLYLRAEKFPKYYYTEMGQHTHNPNANFGSLTIPKHDHTIASQTTGLGSAHSHQVTTFEASVHHDNDNANEDAFYLHPRDDNRHINLIAWLYWVNFGLSTDPTYIPDPNHPGQTMLDPNNPGHTHSLASSTTGYDYPTDQTYSPSGAKFSEDYGGVNDGNFSARSGPNANPPANPLINFSDFYVAIDGTDQTTAILDQFNGQQPSSQQVNNLTSAMSGSGTGPIRLDLLANVSFAPGEHSLVFAVPPNNGANGGGRVLYNLYVE